MSVNPGMTAVAGYRDAGRKSEVVAWLSATLFALAALLLLAPPIQAGSSPSARLAAAAAYDGTRQTGVLFGGTEADVPGDAGLQDTWAWNGTDWTRMSPVSSPGPRLGATMSYDGARQRAVLFGGFSGLALYYGDTWEWDGTNWTQKNPTSTPGNRLGQGLAYDSARQRTVLFGGFFVDPSTLELSYAVDTWEWDGTDWTQRATTTSPDGRAGPSMAYDSARQKTVLFGGARIDPTTSTLFPVQDTWEFDGTNWTQASPASSPSARLGQAMVYDSGRQKTVLLGGFDAQGSALQDTWEWDGTNWAQMSPTSSPPARLASGMFYDVARACTVLVGGGRGPNLGNLRDTWKSDGTNWTDVSPSPPPAPVVTSLTFSRGPARLPAGVLTVTAVFNTDLASGSGPTLSFPVGGDYFGVGATHRVSANTFVFDVTVGPTATAPEGTAYTASIQGAVNLDNNVQTEAGTQSGIVDTAAPSGALTCSQNPGAVGIGALTLTATFSEPVVTTPLISIDRPGLSDDVAEGLMTPTANPRLWTFVHLVTLASPSGLATVTVTGARDAAGNANASLVNAGFTVDPAAALTLGTAAQATFDGSARVPPGRVWLNRSTAPSKRYNVSMAYDPRLGKIVIRGGDDQGSTLYKSCWTWDGTSLAQSGAETELPQALESFGFAYDLARGRQVVFGGSTTAGSTLSPVSSMFEFEGLGAAAVRTVGPPLPARDGQANLLVYDSARKKTVTFGGRGDSADLGDTWEWDGASWTQVSTTTRPPACRSGMMAYLEGLASPFTVLFGGDLSTGALLPSAGTVGETWSFGGTAWSRLAPQTAPAKRSYASLAHDSDRKVAVLFGGSTAANVGAMTNDTWEFDGTNWVQKTPNTATGNPPQRNRAATAYDRDRHATILFGGNGPSGIAVLDDTWAWDGTAWSALSPATKPSARTRHALAYDAARRRVVLFGGSLTSPTGTVQNDTWELDASVPVSPTWTRLFATSASPDQPPARNGHSLTYDSTRQRVVLLGGGTDLTDTWELPSDSPPAVTATYQWDSELASGPTAGLPMKLSATAADADGDPLTYRWTVYGPGGELAGPDASAAVFTPSRQGTYTAHVAVSDGRDGAASAHATFTVVPSVTLTYSKPSSAVSAGSLVITATFAEDPGGAVFMTLDGPGGSNDVQEAEFTPTADPLVWVFTRVFAPTDGVVRVTVFCCGLVPLNPEFTIDGTQPSVSLSYSKPTTAVGPGDLTITATFSERIVTTPTLAIEGVAAPNSQAATPMIPTTDPRVWTFVKTIAPGGDGRAIVRIAGGRDAAGNENQAAWNTGYTLLPSGAEASLALGQPDLSSLQHLARGESGPNSVCIAQGKLLVTDQGNQRVLIWNSLPASNHQPPDLVLGQPGLSSVSQAGSTDAQTLGSPFGVFSDGTRVFVADGANNRVLIWKSFPTVNGQAADVVLGQPNFATKAANHGAARDATGLSWPTGVFWDGSRLWVADLSNN